MISFVLARVAFMIALIRVSATVHDTDVLFIGAGTSGCVLAARLCEALPSLHVTLVERAPPRSEAADFAVRAPGNALKTLGDPELFEIFLSEPEPKVENRVFPILGGATMGGGSSVNGMQWGIPLAGDVDDWKVKGLNETNAEEFFRRVLDKVNFATLEDDNRNIYAQDLFDAAKRAGFEPDDNPFDRRNRRTIFNNRLAINTAGVRQDSCTAYLTPVLNSTCSKNLRLVQGITVTRILFNRRDKGRSLRAFGAEYVYTNDTMATDCFFIRVRKRVISAAGPFNSPKLLQLSGIGPRNVLNKAGIPVLQNLEVGTNAQGRPLVGVVSTYSDQIPMEPLGNDTFLSSPETVMQWRLGNGGPLAAPLISINGRDADNGYFVNTFFVLPAFRPPTAQNESRLFATFCVGNPVSRGTVQIADSNPFAPPKVNLNMLATRKEMDQMSRCLKNMVKIHTRLAPRFDLHFVAPDEGRVTSEYIQKSASFALHHVGACSVGKTLDGSLKVKGTSNVYVVDSSSLRQMPRSAGPMASVFVLAEFAADLFVAELVGEGGSTFPAQCNLW